MLICRTALAEAGVYWTDDRLYTRRLKPRYMVTSLGVYYFAQNVDVIAFTFRQIIDQQTIVCRRFHHIRCIS